MSAARPSPARVLAHALRRRLARALLAVIEYESLTRPRIYGERGRVRLGERVTLNDALLNTVGGTITLGDDTFCGHGVQVLTGTHDITRRGRDRAEHIVMHGRDVHVGRGVWLGSGCLVIGPCRIGDDAVVAAGAVVVGDVAAGTVVAGVPARVVRELPPSAGQAEHAVDE